MKTAAAYIRVSTEMQTEYSPDSQLKLIKDYAQKNNYLLTEIYSDEGISGRKAEKRPAFKKMIADAKKKKFEAILIYNTSRFARNHEESIVYRNMLQREGIDVISITQPSVDYKTDILMNALYAVMDERYSIELSENVKRGMKEKTSRGIYISCAPLGYTRQESNKPLVINKSENILVQWIFNEYRSGNSMFSIARELNAKGYKAKRGNPFDRRGIYRILTNPVYKGFLSWTCDDETIYIKADHEPLIREDVFDKVQAMIAENTRNKIYKTREASLCAHWLSGIIRCPVCGTTYVFLKGYAGRTDRFRCGNYSNAACTNKHSIKALVIESLVLEYLKNTPFADINISKHECSDDILEVSADNKITQLKKALERSKQAYLLGIDTIDEYKKNKILITKEIDSTKNLLNNTAEEPIDLTDIRVRINSIVEVLNSRSDNKDSDNKAKNAVVRNIISKIIIDPQDNALAFYFFS